MKLEPLNDFIVIEALEKPKETESGIVLPETSNEASLQGTVVSIGPGQKEYFEGGFTFKAPSLKVGDKVLFRKQRFERYEVDGKEVYLGNIENVWAKITD